MATATARPAAALAACLALLATAPPARGDDAATSAATSGTAGAIPYWQAPPLPQAVIQGGAIPTGWQPTTVPYQGVGPDGRSVTMYFAPTYVFTYQAGPPVLAVPTPNRRPPAAAPSAAPGAYGWNYQAQGANAVPLALPPATVARYQAPYQFPPDARALSGTPIVPPATPLPGPPAGMAPAMQPPMPPGMQPGMPPGMVSGMAPAQQFAPPPTQWVPSAVPPPPGVAP